MTGPTKAAGRYDVAISGAGPTGLLLAGELAATGARVVVLERAEGLSTVAKANGVVGHAAVELARRGVLTGTRFRIVSPPRFQFGPLELNLGIGPRNPLHVLPIPQRQLEELLQQRALRRGAQIRRFHEVVGFTPTEDQVEIDVRTGPQTVRLHAGYLAGCDGAQSFVRKHAGIQFPGFTSDEIVHIARVMIPADRITPVEHGFAVCGIGQVAAFRRNRLPGGGFSIAPLAALDPSAPPDRYLVSTHEPRGDAAEQGSRDPVEELRASLRRVLGADLPFVEASDVRTTVANSRLADCYRRGRVFLAGDAAHIFNAGGSALNIGLQDALDLADRLGAVVRRGAPPDTLEGYERNRRPAAERTLQHTRAQATLGRDDDEARALREIMGQLLAHRSVARRVARIIERA